MSSLIEIKNIPIKLQLNITHGEMEYSNGSAELKISRDKGGFHMKRTSPQIRIDTFEARNSITPTTMQTVEQNAQKAKQHVYEVMANYAQQGQMLLDAKIGQELVTQFAKNMQTKNVKLNIGIDFIPKAGPNIQWIPGELNMKYEMDRMTYDWNIKEQHFELHRGSVDVSVAQYPEVIIDYIAPPIYVPKSSVYNRKSIDINV